MAIGGRSRLRATATLLGCGAAVIAGALACRHYLEVPYRPNALALLGTLLLATALVTATGRLGARRVLATPPARSLRGG
jgi:peptidoglycan/LPS O-acetylase OafA/YrhL